MPRTCTDGPNLREVGTRIDEATQPHTTRHPVRETHALCSVSGSVSGPAALSLSVSDPGALCVSASLALCVEICQSPVALSRRFLCRALCVGLRRSLCPALSVGSGPDSRTGPRQKALGPNSESARPRHIERQPQHRERSGPTQNPSSPPIQSARSSGPVGPIRVPASSNPVSGPPAQIRVPPIQPGAFPLSRREPQTCFFTKLGRLSRAPTLCVGPRPSQNTSSSQKRTCPER